VKGAWVFIKLFIKHIYIYTYIYSFDWLEYFTVGDSES